MPFSVPCHLCTKKFKTGASLKKHFGLRHQERNIEFVKFLDESNSPCEQPKAAALIDEELQNYLKWLGVLVERINGSLVPDHPGKRLPRNALFLFRMNLHLFLSLIGKWCHIDCLQVPQKYFAHMLHQLGNPMLDSVRDVRHLRQPIFKRKARRFSYKIFNEETFERVLQEQDILQFRPRALFRNSDEVADVSEMPAEEALAYARARARKQDSRPTSRSIIEIGQGEGRCTRELELVWWPSLYSRCSEYGKLTFRFFVTKTSL